MTPARWAEIKALFSAAMEKPRSEWEAFLNESCPDASLRAEVRKLLEAEDAPALKSPIPDMLMQRALPPVIGRYRIVRLLGEGGMGCVYEAEQDQPRRRVAIKSIKAGFANPALLRRFEHEAQALGLLHHPGIAQIYEAGTADIGAGPQPYFAMEFIEGPSLLRYAKEHRLSVRQRLELMAKVCDAVHHAHQRGIIHRDLKPGNILVEESGQPKILDFGVARVTDLGAPAPCQTDFGQILGTLAYMSPEQVLADPSEVDTRTDVYALGVILFELFAGHLPYMIGDQMPKAVQTICETDPERLSSIDRTYRGDIETIVAKALEKDKSRRYSSAAELAADIERYLNDEPIVARRSSTAYHLQKFARRHSALVSAVAVALVMLIAGVIASTWEAARAWRAEEEAVRQRDVAAAAQQAAQTARQAAQTARDRAISAEKSAEAERNRALAEEHHADTQSATAKAISDFLQNDLLSQASVSVQALPGSKPDPDLKVRTALDRAAARITGKFGRQPLVEAAIRQTIGNVYEEIGVFPEAERQFRHAFDLRRRTLGEQHHDTLQSSYSLAWVFTLEGRFAEAEPILRKTLATWRRVLGPAHPDTLSATNTLGVLYTATGKYALAESLLTGAEHPDSFTSRFLLGEAYNGEGRYRLAEPLYLKLLEDQRRVLGEEHPDALLTMVSLADAYRLQGKYADAEPLYINALETERRVLGPQHRYTTTAMNNLALNYRGESRFADAEALFKQVLEIARRVMGEENTDTLTGMDNLAETYRQEGKYKLAESLFLQTLDKRRRLIGEENPMTLRTMFNLARVYQQEGRRAEAKPLVAQVLEVRRRILGEEHPDTLRAIEALAGVYSLEGRYREAAPLNIKVLETWRRLMGQEHPYTLTSQDSLAALYMAEGDYDRAEPLLNQAVEIRRRVYGNDHKDNLISRYFLGDLYRREGKYALAEPILVQVLAADRRVFGDEHPDTRTAEVGLAILYRSEGRYTQAEPLNTKAWEAQRGVLGEEHPSTLISMTSLGILYQEEGRYAEAEPLLMKALPLDARVLGASDENTRVCLASLAKIRLAQHRYAEAESLLQESLSTRESEGPYAWQPFERRSLLGLSLMEQSKFAEAEPLLTSGYQGLAERKSAVPATLSLPDAGERIIRLYNAWGKSGQTAEWRKQLQPRLPDAPDADH